MRMVAIPCGMWGGTTRMVKANWQEKDFLTPISISTLLNTFISAIGY
jgi:hypothetical protein